MYRVDSGPIRHPVSSIQHQPQIGASLLPQSTIGLRLDSYANVMAGSQTGPVVIPGKPDESELVGRVRGIDQPRMPFGKPPLQEGEIGVIVRWVEAGAPENNKTGSGN